MLDFATYCAHTLFMAEQIPTIGNYGNDFRGNYVDIELVDGATLTEQLKKDGLQTYIDVSDPESLPYPAHQVALDSYCDPENELHIVGAVRFSPTAVENAPDNWSTLLLNKLREYFEAGGYEVTRQKHDPLGLYIPLTASTSIHVALHSTTDECAIGIELFTTGQPEDITDHPLHKPYVNQNLTRLEKLRHALKTIGITLDNLGDSFNPPSVHRKKYVLQQYLQPEEPDTPHTTETISVQHHESEMRETTPPIEDGIDSVGGATYAKNRLREFAAIMKNPAEAAEFDIKPSHFILYGPPGTGKTTLVNAFAREINATLVPVTSADVVDKWVGQSSRNIVEIFNKAKVTPGNVVLFFDEFDTLAQSGNSTSERSDVRKTLNTELEHLSKNCPNIIVAAATNADRDDLDPSLIRPGRFELIQVPAPTEQERYGVFGTILFKAIQRTTPNDSELVILEYSELPSGTKPFMLYDPAIDIGELVRCSDGLTGADFEAVLARACHKRFLHLQETGERVSITQELLLDEIKNFYR